MIATNRRTSAAFLRISKGRARDPETTPQFSTFFLEINEQDLTSDILDYLREQN